VSTARNAEPRPVEHADTAELATGETSGQGDDEKTIEWSVAVSDLGWRRTSSRASVA